MSQQKGDQGPVADGVLIPDDKTGDIWEVPHKKNVRQGFEDKEAFPGGHGGPGSH